MKQYKRLEIIAEMCRGAKSVIDVGCNHAKLCVHLIKNCAVLKAYASEIGEGPLNNAIRTIEKSGMADKITPVLCDGLDAFSPEDADTIVIAGMGGDEIISIIAKAPWLCDGKHRLILQPMTRAESVRRYLCENGFAIEDEKLVRDTGRIYAVMNIAFCEDKSGNSHNEYLFSDCLFEDELFSEYLDRRIIKYGKLVENRKKAKLPDIGELAAYNVLINAKRRVGT